MLHALSKTSTDLGEYLVCQGFSFVKYFLSRALTQHDLLNHRPYDVLYLAESDGEGVAAGVVQGFNQHLAPDGTIGNPDIVGCGTAEGDDGLRLRENCLRFRTHQVNGELRCRFGIFSRGRHAIAFYCQEVIWRSGVGISWNAADFPFKVDFINAPGKQLWP